MRWAGLSREPPCVTFWWPNGCGESKNLTWKKSIFSRFFHLEYHMHSICAPDSLFSKVINFCKMWRRGSWVVLNLAVKRAPQPTSANPPKRFFAHYKIVLHFFCTFSSWNSTVLTVLDFLFWWGKMSSLLNVRIERPNNQEPVLGTDKRAIIFKTPFKLFGWKSEYQLQ